MAISAYVGLHGSGKSYGVVENVIIPAVQAKRVVWTNIPLNLDAFDDRFGVVPVIFDIKDVLENPAWFQDVLPKGALVVIDEVWRLWPQGMTVVKMPKGHQEFLAEHRHLVGGKNALGEDWKTPVSTEIVVVVQRLNMLANGVRSQIHETYRCKKMTVAGSGKRYRVDIFDGAQDGNPPIDKRLREIHGSFRQEIFDLYKSHTKSEVGAGFEARADGRANVLRGFKVKAILAALVIMPIITVWLFYRLYHAYNMDSLDDSSADSLEPSVSPQVAQAAVSSSQIVQETEVEPISRVLTPAGEFLSQFPELTIASNSLDYPKWIIFEADLGDRQAVFSLEQISKMGDVEMTVISSCAIQLKSGNVSSWAFCAKEKRATEVFGVPVAEIPQA